MPLVLGDVSLCRGEECANKDSGFDCSQLDGRMRADWLLRSISRDPVFMSRLRAFLLREGFGMGAHLSDAAVANFIDFQLRSGRLRFCRRATERTSAPAGDPAPTSGASAATVKTEKPFPLAARSRTEPQSSGPAAGDLSLFPADVKLSALADMLKEASIQGVPFCEECLAKQSRA